MEAEGRIGIEGYFSAVYSIVKTRVTGIEQVETHKEQGPKCMGAKICSAYRLFKLAKSWLWLKIGTLEYLIIAHCAFIYFQEKSCPVPLLTLYWTVL